MDIAKQNALQTPSPLPHPSPARANPLVPDEHNVRGVVARHARTCRRDGVGGRRGGGR
ncbi:hypothetical protein K438DRAFT_1832984 [Mycena galopus ATCC 62051]|nr:hypothetical protein K438DRAFT_1832984 [Mycena galopus ATCC 62051]